MKDPNQERGKSLFLQKTENHGLELNDAQQARLTALRAAFEDQVGVMPIDKDGVFGAARLATAVLEVVGHDDPTLDQGQGVYLVQCVIAAYQNAKNPAPKQATLTQRVSADMTEEERAKKQGRKIENSLVLPANATAHERLVWEGQQAALKQLEEDAEPAYVGMNNSFDLIKDIKKVDLGTEGLRVRGYLPADYDTVAGGAVVIDLGQENDGPQGIVTFAADGSVERIQCPFCVERFGPTRVNAEGETEYVGVGLYPAGLDKMGCFDCDREFEVELTLDDQVQQGSGFWHGVVDEEEIGEDDLPEGFGPTIIIARS
jgi:hypothetical protein